MIMVNQFISLINGGSSDIFARFEAVHDQTVILPEAKVWLGLEYSYNMDLTVELTENTITLKGSHLSLVDVLADPLSRPDAIKHSSLEVIQTVHQSIVVINASKTETLIILEPWYDEISLSHNEYCVLNITFENDISLELECMLERFVIYCPVGSIVNCQ